MALSGAISLSIKGWIISIISSGPILLYDHFESTDNTHTLHIFLSFHFMFAFSFAQILGSSNAFEGKAPRWDGMMKKEISRRCVCWQVE